MVKPEGSSTLYQYYQDKDGRIIENQRTSGKWLIEGDDVPKSAIIATNAQSGSPIAATSWSSNGVLFVRIFTTSFEKKLN